MSRLELDILSKLNEAITNDSTTPDDSKPTSKYIVYYGADGFGLSTVNTISSSDKETLKSVFQSAGARLPKSFGLMDYNIIAFDYPSKRSATTIANKLKNIVSWSKLTNGDIVIEGPLDYDDNRLDGFTSTRVKVSPKSSGLQSVFYGVSVDMISLNIDDYLTKEYLTAKDIDNVLKYCKSNSIPEPSMCVVSSTGMVRLMYSTDALANSVALSLASILEVNEYNNGELEVGGPFTWVDGDLEVEPSTSIIKINSGETEEDESNSEVLSPAVSKPSSNSSSDAEYNNYFLLSVDYKAIGEDITDLKNPELSLIKYLKDANLSTDVVIVDLSDCIAIEFKVKSEALRYAIDLYKVLIPIPNDCGLELDEYNEYDEIIDEIQLALEDNTAPVTESSLFVDDQSSTYSVYMCSECGASYLCNNESHETKTCPACNNQSLEFISKATVLGTDTVDIP